VQEGERLLETLRLAGVVDESIVDGPGFRMAVFTQGCPHHCPGCHNPQTHDFSGGYSETVKALADRYRANPLLQGVTLSGGEPFCQAPALAALCRLVREAGGDVWAYSGYTFEQLTAPDAPDGAGELLSLCDVLVDGRFEIALRNLELYYRGSENQRVIDVPRSLKEGRAIPVPLEE